MPDLTFANPASPLARFHDIHAGARVVIVCNGPSLNGMDLSFLRQEIVIGLNKIHLGLDRFGFYPSYLVAVNPKVVAQAAAELRAMTCIKFIGAQAAVAGNLPQDAFTCHIRTEGVTGPFCRDITDGVREGHTVTHAALQIARFMGAGEVVIIGMDHRFEMSGPANAPLRMRGADPNHFSPDYFRDSDWDAPNLAGSEASYRAALHVFQAENRRIVDATVGGACTVFPKRDYTEVFGL